MIGVVVLGSAGTSDGYAGSRSLPAREHTPAVDPSGETMPVGDLPGWQQVFQDDFRTDVPLGSFPQTVGARWSAYAEGWRDTSKNGTYSPSQVISVQNGMMDLHLRNANGVHLVAAPGPRLPGPGTQGGQLYGRYAVRYRADPIPGYKLAWLLWPDSEDWSDGEIDFPEGSLGGNTMAFMHHRGKPVEQDRFTSAARLQDWHTAVIEWTPDSVRFLLDGAGVGESTDRRLIPRVPMHWVLQTETSSGGRRPAADGSGHVQIDWVTAYRRE